MDGWISEEAERALIAAAVARNLGGMDKRDDKDDTEEDDEDDTLA